LGEDTERHGQHERRPTLDRARAWNRGLLARCLARRLRLGRRRFERWRLERWRFDRHELVDHERERELDRLAQLDARSLRAEHARAERRTIDRAQRERGDEGL